MPIYVSPVIFDAGITVSGGTLVADTLGGQLESRLAAVEQGGGGGGPHASSHQNGGADEISVAGLSGVLADPQTPATHTHAATDLVSATVPTARLGSGTADATTFLRGDQTWATPAGGGGGDTLVVLSADTGRTVLATGESGLSFAAAANTRYKLEAHVRFRTAATTTGIALQANGPAANFFVMQRRIPISLIATNVGQARAYNSGASSTGVDAAGVDNLAILEGLLSVAGSAGTFHITYGSEVAASRVSVMVGSVLAYRTY